MNNLEGKVVFEGATRSGKPLLIRYIKKEDAASMTNYINSLSDERTFISFQGEHKTLEEESDFIESQIKRINEGKSIELLAFSNGELIGVNNLDLGQRIEKHIANLGLSVAKEFRNEGVGSKLLELIIDEGKKHLTGLDIVTLGVFASNEVAINLYKKHGFIEFGSLPRGVKLETGYVDHVHMYKTIDN